MESSPNKPKLRMYSIVLYNLSSIQKGIQSGHANIRYGREHASELFDQWADIDQTVVILDGGGSPALQEVINTLTENGVVLTKFNEPDLYNGVTAISFLVDERVWNRIDYPDLAFQDEYIMARANGRTDVEEKLKKEHIELIGGETNYFLKTYLQKFKLSN